MRRVSTWIKLFVLAFVIVGFAGCDTVEDLFSKEKEAQGIVEVLGESSLTVDGIEYAVTSRTKYEGIDGLNDLAVGDEVEIEYEEKNGGREAVEIERAGSGD